MAKELTKKEFTELLVESIAGALKELGIGQAEIKTGMIPQPTKEDEDKFAKLSNSERFKEFLRGVVFNDKALVKALGGNVDADGGYLLPTEFRAEVVEQLEKVGVMRPLVRVIKVKTRSGEMPKIASKPVVSWATENEDIAESEPTFGQIVYSLKRMAVFSAISRDLLADTPIDLTALLKELFAEAIARAEDDAMTNGDGSTIPIVGILKDTNVGVADIGTDGLKYDDLVEAFYSIPAPYRGRAVFMTNGKGLEVLRKIKDDNGNPILMPPTQGGTPTVFGRPVVENPQINTYDIDTNNDGTADTTATDIVIADFKNAYLFDSNEFGIEATKEGGDAFRKHQVWIKTWNRIDFKVAIPEAFRIIKNVY